MQNYAPFLDSVSSQTACMIFSWTPWYRKKVYNFFSQSEQWLGTHFFEVDPKSIPDACLSITFCNGQDFLSERNEMWYSLRRVEQFRFFYFFVLLVACCCLLFPLVPSCSFLLLLLMLLLFSSMLHPYSSPPPLKRHSPMHAQLILTHPLLPYPSLSICSIAPVPRHHDALILFVRTDYCVGGNEEGLLIVLKVRNVSMHVKLRRGNSMGVEGMSAENKKNPISQQSLPHPSAPHILA